MFGDLGGHVMYGDPLPIHFAGNYSSKICQQCCQSVVEPPDIFLWGFVKDDVYRTLVRDLADLQDAAVNNVTPQMLHNTWVEVEYRYLVSS